MRGPGKYDKAAREAMEATGGETVLLVVINGNMGGGFSLVSVADYAHIQKLVPHVLRTVADGIEREADN